MILKVIGKWPSSLHDKIEELPSDFLMTSPFERDLQQNVVVSFFSVFFSSQEDSFSKSKFVDQGNKPDLQR